MVTASSRSMFVSWCVYHGKSGSLSSNIEALKKVFNLLSVLADLSHSHDVTGIVYGSLGSCDVRY